MSSMRCCRVASACKCVCVCVYVAALHSVPVYIRDCVAQLLEAKSERPLEFVAE